MNIIIVQRTSRLHSKCKYTHRRMVHNFPSIVYIISYQPQASLSYSETETYILIYIMYFVVVVVVVIHKPNPTTTPCLRFTLYTHHKYLYSYYMCCAVINWSPYGNGRNNKEYTFECNPLIPNIRSN